MAKSFISLWHVLRYLRLAAFNVLWVSGAPLALLTLWSAQAGAFEFDQYARHALWGVVRTCAVDHHWFGAAYPCLKIEAEADTRPGFVFLDPPLGPDDLILVPTRKVT
jgi:CDP-diacylglycerol pyrophosphatase